MIAQVLLALHECRSYGIVHCDLKPSNILVNDGERFVVADFNAAVPNKSVVKENSKATHYYSRCDPAY